MSTETRPLTGRVALVTGASRGIGRAIATRLAADGAAIGINFRRDAEAARSICEQILKDGGSARTYQASIASPDDVADMAQRVNSELGPVDLLVCNAGVASRGLTVATTDPAEVSNVFETHALGAFRLCQLVLPQMRTRPRGDIIMISTAATTRPMFGGAPYAMAKAALEALAYTLAVEEVTAGIHTNIVAPGLVTTDMGDRLARAVTGEGSAADLDALSPYGRVCRPSDVADVVAYLASSHASYLNGQRIQVDGGGTSLPDLQRPRSDASASNTSA